MAVVHVPTQMRPFTDGRDRLEVAGATLRQVFAALEADWPAMREQIVQDGRIRPQLAVAVDGAIAESGLVQAVSEDAEIYLIPAIGGGAAGNSRCCGGRAGGPADQLRYRRHAGSR